MKSKSSRRTAEESQRALAQALSKCDAANESLAQATESLRARNEQFDAFLDGRDSPMERVANAASVSIEDATERARKYWDAQDAKRPSAAPPRPQKQGTSAGTRHED